MKAGLTVQLLSSPDGAVVATTTTSAAGLYSFADVAEVTFAPLTAEEIAYYVERHSPLDRAGAYGVQDWIGYVAVARIEGSFYTVMGLPLHRVYAELVRLGRT